MAVLSKQIDWRTTVKSILVPDSGCERFDELIGAAFLKIDAGQVGGIA